VHSALPRGFPGRNYAYGVSLPWDERYLEGVTLLPFQRDLGILSSDFVKTAQAGSEPLENFRDYIRNAPAQDPISRVLYLDTKTYLPGDILTKVDRMSMATSLEARVPLLDHVFVEWVAGLPAGWKIRDGNQKYIFKKLAERVGVPREVLYRRKQGFALPLVQWMRNELKDMIHTILLEPRTLQRGYFNPYAVRQLLQDHFHGGRDQSARIWRLLMLELWHRNFLNNIGKDEFTQQLDHAVALRGELG
jgi:asparagine synthase (glutamine-hydrolysing)